MRNIGHHYTRKLFAFETEVGLELLFLQFHDLLLLLLYLRFVTGTLPLNDGIFFLLGVYVDSIEQPQQQGYPGKRIDSDSRIRKIPGPQNAERKVDRGNHSVLVVYLGTETIRAERKTGKFFLQVRKAFGPLTGGGQPFKPVAHVQRKIVVDRIGQGNADIIES